MSELKANKISPAGTAAMTLGDSGDTFTIPSGASIVNNGTATGFSTVTDGGILQMFCKQDATRASDTTVTGISNTSWQSGAIWSAMTTTITPEATSSYIYFSGDFGICAKSGYGAHLWVTYQAAGGSEIPMQGQLGNRPVGQRIENARDTTSMESPISVSGMFAPNTTGVVTIRVRTGLSNGANGGIFFHQTTASSTNSSDGANPMSTFTVWEVAGSINPSITNASINS
jgi:hypothetical protein